MLCERPVYIKNVEGLVSCGHCFPCRLNKRRQWTFRLVLETMVHQKNSWWGLSYDDAHLPHEVYDKDGVVYESESLGTLDPNHLSNFIKRLRGRCDRFRFYGVGEYGERFSRPHYHLCLWGVDSSVIDSVQTAWPYGRVTYEGPLSLESCQYTAGYTVKKMTKASDDRLDGRYPEYARFSQGIGKGAINQVVAALGLHVDRIHNIGDIPHSFSYNGRQWPLDRYMRSRIFYDLDLDGLKEERYENYKKEMSLMLARSKDAIPAKFGASKEFSLEHMYRLDNAQKLLNTARRLELFDASKRRKERTTL